MLLRADHPGATGRLALGCAVPLVVAALVVATVVLDARVPDPVREALDAPGGLVGGLTGLVLAVAAGVLLARSPRSPIGWAMAGFGLFWVVDTLAIAWTGVALSRTPPSPGAWFGIWAYERAGSALLLALPLLLALYPSGRLPEGRGRRRAIAGLAMTAVLPLILVVAPADVVLGEDVPPLLDGVELDPTTLPIPDGLALVLLAAGLPLAAIGALTCTAGLVARNRGATGVERQRLLWLLWAGMVDALLLAMAVVVRGPLIDVGMLLATAVTATAVVIGLVRPTLGDVDELIGGTFVYGVLAVVVVALDLGVVALTGRFLGDRIGDRSTLLLVLLVAALVYLPARQVLWRFARRTLLGNRDDPYAVVSALAARLETADDPAEQLPAVAAAVAEAFKVRYVEVEVERAGGDRVTARHGTPPAETEALPISYRGEVVGRLLLPRHGLRAQLSGRDERLLGDVVRQAAVATRSAQLAEQLQASREALVTSREEERRRLRRDLHDGLGPTLGAVVLRIDTARNLARTDPGKADEVLRQTRADVAGALEDVRRLVHDLRPPALDDVGVVKALEQLGHRLSGDIVVEVRHGELGELPAAVEVAVYRIASEAMNNAVRHSGGRACTVTLTREDRRVVAEIADDGTGIAPDRVSGVGLLSVRERAAELGGRCEISCPPGGGTLVRAELPL